MRERKHVGVHAKALHARRRYCVLVEVAHALCVVVWVIMRVARRPPIFCRWFKMRSCPAEVNPFASASENRARAAALRAAAAYADTVATAAEAQERLRP